MHRRQPDRMESVCTPSRRPRPALRRTGAEASLRAGAQSKPRRSSSDRVTAAGEAGGHASAQWIGQAYSGRQ
ncbi:hypothetical protein [Lysobacter gummosus]|uniref:hypothetical protein n=1 Tax=Lysobacter gummosus TaxID=262324 RepID=UPI0036413668